MSKLQKAHYVPYKDRIWVKCCHPDKDCTAMRNTGLCGWNQVCPKCEWGDILSEEEIKNGVGNIMIGFTQTPRE